MSNDIIIHISDLHITDSSGKFGKPNPNSYLTTGNKPTNFSFINQFIDKVKSFPKKNIYLIITGDTANIAEEVEYIEAEKLIKYILAELKIKKENFLLIPGDHDVHRDTIKEELRKDGNKEKKGHELLEEKFNNFNKLYKAVKGSDFDAKTIIFDKIIVDDIILLAANSNYNIDQFGGIGFLPILQVENELKQIRSEYITHEVILCLHHNLQGEYDDKTSGQWDSDNRRDLFAIFQRYNVKCIFNGNEHTPNSKFLAGYNIIISDTGPLTSKEKPDAAFKIYEIQNESKNLSLINNVFGLRKVGGHSEGNFGNWIAISTSELNGIELERFVLREENNVSLVEKPYELPSNFEEIEVLIKELTIDEEIKIYDNLVAQNKLYKIIKDKKLFHQGHFHWSETSRAHNWIDTAKLLEERDDLFFINNSIVDVAEKLDLLENCDLIIGLGYEGNIISSKLTIKYDIPYTFLPYSYRYNDHLFFEKKMEFENDDSKYKKVLIITDVVNDGGTIRNLINNEAKAFFENVEAITVISLFYTGTEELRHDILNRDDTTIPIDFFTIKALKIEKCPYGVNYKTECFIYCDQLNMVHKFYTEE